LRPQQRSGRTLRLAFWAAAAFAFVMAALPHPLELPGAPSDKVQHVIAFVTLGLLGASAYPATSLVQLALRLSVFGALIELVQAIPALHRDSSVLDWIADTVACSAVLVAINWWRSRRAGASRTRDNSAGD
jgi:VanZ family protein